MNDDEFKNLPWYKKAFWGAVLWFGLAAIGFLAYVGYATFFGVPGRPIITPEIIGTFIGGAIAGALLSLVAQATKGQ